MQSIDEEQGSPTKIASIVYPWLIILFLLFFCILDEAIFIW